MDSQIDELLASLTSRTAELQSSGQWSDKDGMLLYKQLADIQNQIQPPTVVLQNLTQAVRAIEVPPRNLNADIEPQSHAITSARVALAMGIFDAYTDAQTDTLSLDELQPLVKGEPALLKRIMRLLTTNGLTKQVTTDSWALTSSGALIRPESPPAAMIDHFYDHLRSHAMLLEFLEASEFCDPVDTYNGPWQYAFRTSKQYFEWLAEDERRQRCFNTIMTINANFRGQDWFDFFPVQNKLICSAEDEVVLVDVGGGIGHDLCALKARMPELKGVMILQDLPRVIDSVAKSSLPPGVVAQKHDMFTNQPVKGAKAYYLRTVLHDWPDVQAIQVLEKIREAMAPHSLLLLNENLMDEDHLSDTTVCVDFIMMNAMAARERTESDWRILLDRAGFKLVQVWYPQGVSVSPSALFEAVST